MVFWCKQRQCSPTVYFLALPMPSLEKAAQPTFFVPLQAKKKGNRPPQNDVVSGGKRQKKLGHGAARVPQQPSPEPASQANRCNSSGQFSARPTPFLTGGPTVATAIRSTGL